MKAMQLLDICVYYWTHKWKRDISYCMLCLY